LERVIRVLLHYYGEEGAGPCHVYRNGAEVLRPDRAPLTGRT
jgi:chorismate mutase